MKDSTKSGLVLCSIFATATVVAVSCLPPGQVQVATSESVVTGAADRVAEIVDSEKRNSVRSHDDKALKITLPQPIDSDSIEMEPLAASDDFASDFEPMKVSSAAPAAPAPARPPSTRSVRSIEHPKNNESMTVMAPAEIMAEEVDTDLPPSQTTMTVFYATDRKSEFGISSSDWIKIHFAALVALAFYIVTFASVFMSQKKVFYGFTAFTSLIVFLVLGQAASVNWQKHKRLAANGDVTYVSEIRKTGSGNLLDYGSCRVTIPPNHKVGHLDSPSLFKLEFREDPEKHVVLHRVIRSEKDKFYNQLNQAIAQSEIEQSLVFVHGYNVSFENAVKRTAQIAHDLKFDGAPICYSWSSHGALANYTRDMANADATVVALQTFLQETVNRTGNTTIHLVAHSMGNRALLQALDRIALGSTRTTNKMFGQLVMAAPDVSVNDFQNRYIPSAKQLAEQVTLYASSKDRALIASTRIHGHDRAGLAGDQLVVIDGMDTVDVSEIDTSLIGHSYYGDHPELIKDLRALVELSQPASQRSWLTRITNPNRFDYFRFVEHEMRSADKPGNQLQSR